MQYIGRDGVDWVYLFHGRQEVRNCKHTQIRFFIIKTTRCTNSSDLLWHETLHVSGISSAHHQGFIYCTLSNGICHTGLWTTFEQDQDRNAVPSCSCSKAVFKPVWHTPVPSVQRINSWRWTEELPETFRVSCRSKFGKLVHLVGFIIKKFVTMHGHMNVKYTYINSIILNEPFEIEPGKFCTVNKRASIRIDRKCLCS
jgi:hypothetical protein